MAIANHIGDLVETIHGVKRITGIREQGGEVIYECGSHIYLESEMQPLVERCVENAADADSTVIGLGHH